MSQAASYALPVTVADATIGLVTGRDDILRCHAVMLELRPHLTDPEAFATQVERQHAQGYRLACLEAAGTVRSLAGYRISEKLSAGNFLYVDDLVTRGVDASRGFGGLLFDWLIERAREADCTQLQLDSAVWRFGAHRFYLRKGMDITAHHFDVKLVAHRREGRAGSPSQP